MLNNDMDMTTVTSVEQAAMLAPSSEVRPKRRTFTAAQKPGGAGGGWAAAGGVGGAARSSLYAARQPHSPVSERTAARPANALSPAEQTAIWEMMNSPRFADHTPYEIVPQLLDEGRYLG